MLGHRQLRDSLGLRPRLKSNTVSTLLHILSHCSGDSQFIDEACQPHTVTKSCSVSSSPSENSRLCTNLLREIPVNSCPGNQITISNPEHSGSQNGTFPEGNSCPDHPMTSSNPEPSGSQNGTFSEGNDCPDNLITSSSLVSSGSQNGIFPEGSERAVNLRQVTHAQVDYAGSQVDGFSIDSEKLADEMNPAASATNEISYGRVVLGMEDLDTIEYDKLFAERETLSSEGSLTQNLHVMQGVEIDRRVCLSNKEVDTIVENEQTTNGNTLAMDCGAETLCDETYPAGNPRTLVSKEAQYKEILYKVNSEIGNLTIVKDSIAGENPELDRSQNCTGEICHKTQKEGKTLEILKSSNAITNSSSETIAVSTSGKHDFVNLNGGREIEDGEISDDSEISLPLLDLFLEDASATEEWRPENKGTSDIKRKDDFPLGNKSQTEVDDLDSSVFGVEGSGGQSETGLPSRTSKIRGMTVAYSSFNATEENVCCNWNKDKMHEHARDHDTVELQKAISAVILTQNQGEQSEEKDFKIREKKKRTVTEGRKSKKKLAKKRKRAEKNRKLGVKRLKLEPISKPKVVSHCKYYLKGRCQQGDKCNFSHDTIPLTKSQPCKYFALKSCLKGDDCPYDHELSKYPCHNYTFKGICIRGDSCLFSHKVPVSQGSPKEPNDNQNLQKHPNRTNEPDVAAKNLFNRTSPGAPSPLGSSLDKRHKEQLVEKRPRPALGAPPEGITLLSFGKPPVHLSKTEPQNASNPKSTNMTEPFKFLASPLPSHLSANSSTGGFKNYVNLSPKLQCASQSRLQWNSDGVKNNLSPKPQCSSQPRSKMNSDDVKNQRSSCPSESQSIAKGSLLATSASRRPEKGATDTSSILEEFLFGSLG